MNFHDHYRGVDVIPENAADTIRKQNEKRRNAEAQGRMNARKGIEDRLIAKDFGISLDDLVTHDP